MYRVVKASFVVNTEFEILYKVEPFAWATAKSNQFSYWKISSFEFPLHRKVVQMKTQCCFFTFHCTEKWSFPLRISSANPFAADLVTLTGEILNENFTCCAVFLKKIHEGINTFALYFTLIRLACWFRFSWHFLFRYIMVDWWATIYWICGRWSICLIL